MQQKKNNVKLGQLQKEINLCENLLKKQKGNIFSNKKFWKAIKHSLAIKD